MTKINLNTNASYNFVATEIEDDANKKVEVVFPTQEIKTIAADDDVTVVIQRSFTAINLTVEDDVTLAATLSAGNLKAGDKILISATATGDDRELVLSENLGGKTIELTENVEQNILLVFDGTGFKMIGEKGDKGDKGDPGEDGEDAVIDDNSIVPAKLQKGIDDQKTYYLKSVLGVVQWVEET